MANTVGNASSAALIGGLGLMALVQPFGCGVQEAPIDPLITELLAAVGPAVVLPALERYSEALDVAAFNIEEYRGLVGSEEGPDTLYEAKVAFNAASALWQQVELMQIGPAGSSLATIGGADLRDSVYSWPVVNPCRVDQETALGNWDDDGFFEGLVVNAYGLDALEQVLFAGPANACPGQVPPNSDGAWDALGDYGVTENRAFFAEALVHQAQLDAEALRISWTSEGQDWSAELAAAGQGSSFYATQNEGLNAVYDALFYAELLTKDRKLAQPLGDMDCDTTTCPDDVEALLSGQSTLLIAANLDGFDALFHGGDGVGMDDLLVDVGHGDLATAIAAALDGARQAATALGQPIDTGLADKPEDVRALHDAVKVLTDLVKGDLATVLSLQVPSDAAGDND